MSKVNAPHALKVKGKKCPKPDSLALGDVKAAPKHKPSNNKKLPSHPVKAGDQSMAPDTKKKAMPHECAPEGASSLNGGESLPMEKDHSLKK